MINKTSGSSLRFAATQKLNKTQNNAAGRASQARRAGGVPRDPRLQATPISPARLPLLKGLMEAAIEQAYQGLREGGIPIGSVLARKDGTILAVGHNRRVQKDSNIHHAEMNCLELAGRRSDWSELILVSTLSPCPMCTGASLLFKIPTVVIGENHNFMGAEDWFEKEGVELIRMQNPKLIGFFADWIRKHPTLWNEDIAIPAKKKKI